MSNHSIHAVSSEQAREDKQLRIALVDSMTHELRAPLTSIKASVTALLTNSQLQPSQRNELLIVINEEADRLNRLVGETVETAQPGSPVKLDLKPHAIEEIINAARETCRTALGQRSVSVQLPPGLPLVRADLNFAKKAFVQLLENAAKYSPRNQPITIAAELIGTFVMTSVADQGSGIAESEQRLIFEKFYRGRDHPPLNPWNWNGIAHCECDYQGARWLAEGYKPAELRLHHFFHFTDRLAPVP